MAKGLAKQYFNSLNNTGGKSSGPEDRLGFNLLIALIAELLCVKHHYCKLDLFNVDEVDVAIDFLCTT